jgi:hypothetical protein
MKNILQDSDFTKAFETAQELNQFVIDISKIMMENYLNGGVCH